MSLHCHSFIFSYIYYRISLISGHIADKEERNIIYYIHVYINYVQCTHICISYCIYDIQNCECLL